VDVLTDVIGASKVVKVVKEIHELATVWAKAWAALQFTMAGITSAVGVLQNYSVSVSLPTVGYADAAEGLRPVEDETPAGTGGRR
ncbi:MAG TPA: hypothetical protein VJX10_12025, partial [Pseudonocardiaceae bacterium]|nr:hypothetical protein [Pseudonocardiaceae bacterium]